MNRHISWSTITKPNPRFFFLTKHFSAPEHIHKQCLHINMNISLLQRLCGSTRALLPCTAILSNHTMMRESLLTPTLHPLIRTVMNTYSNRTIFRVFQKLNYHLQHQLGQHKMALSETCWRRRQHIYHCHVNSGGEIKAITIPGSSRTHMQYLRHHLFMFSFQVQFRNRGSEKNLSIKISLS